MKKRLKKIGTLGAKALTIIALLVSFTLAYSAQKRALVIGVATNTEDSKWASTHADNDARVMKATLEQKGFQHVTMITNEQATKLAVVNAINAIYDDCEEGDVFVFYFSGHGQLVKDQNGDEFDGYDEALVLYGAPKYYDGLYRNESHLLDEELSKMLNKVRAKIGHKGEVLVLLEAGFGWDDSAEHNNIRGGAQPLQKTKNRVDLESIGQYEVGIIDDLPFGAPNASYASIIEFTATRINRVAHEYEGNGIFTLAVARAFEETPDSSTYLVFYQAIVKNSKDVSALQKPNYLGSMDEIVFANHIPTFRNSRGVANTTKKELILMKQLDYENTEEMKKEEGKTDWEKSFFEPDKN